ncbi:hypothetical protein E1176_00105 [Fulvivirga sp. RKSG066]|nr:hypothetical protein [Fulvivirga aurantia]
MDPWPQLIYLEANGQSTIYEFVYQMAAKYGRGQEIPNELDITILDMINSLMNDRLIELIDSKKELPYYLDKPIAEQDKEKAHQLMVKDGFIKE